MKFSRHAERFLAKSGTLQLMDDLGAANASSEPVLMLGGGNPAHIDAVEEHLRLAMAEIVDNKQMFGSMVGDYDGPQGNAEFIQTLARELNNELGWDISSENIVLTNGSQSGFSLLFNSLAGEYADGTFKKILLPIAPEYIGYSDLGTSSQHDGKKEPVSLIEARKPSIERMENGFFKYHIDFDSLQLDERYGAVCVSRPTNPTGNVISNDELKKLAIACKEANIPLIIDGAYGLPFPNMVYCDAEPYWDENTILCLSLSKLGLPGTRTGIVIANKEVVGLLRGANAVSALAPGSVGAVLATQLLKNNVLLKLGREVIRPYYEQKMQYAVQLVQHEMKGLPVYIHQPEGALFLWLWFEELPVSSEELYQLLKEKGVYVLAGQHFFAGLDEAVEKSWKHKHECIRINYAGERGIVEQGIAIVAQTVRDIYAT